MFMMCRNWSEYLTYFAFYALPSNEGITNFAGRETDSENYLSKFTQLVRGKTVLHCLQAGHFLRFLKQ